MKKFFASLFLLAALAACKGYTVEVAPPDCAMSGSQQECQQHTQTPVLDEVDDSPELWKQ